MYGKADIAVNHSILPACHDFPMTTTFQSRIAEALKDSGLSQAEFARRVGIHRATVGDWVKGRSADPKLDAIFSAADVLRVQAQWLATGHGPKERLQLTPENLSLVAAYQKLTQDERDAIRLMLDRMTTRRDHSAAA